MPNIDEIIKRREKEIGLSAAKRPRTIDDILVERGYVPPANLLTGMPRKDIEYEAKVGYEPLPEKSLPKYETYTPAMEKKTEAYSDDKKLYEPLPEIKAGSAIPKFDTYITGMEDKKAAYANSAIVPITKMESKDEAYKDKMTGEVLSSYKPGFADFVGKMDEKTKAFLYGLGEAAGGGSLDRLTESAIKKNVEKRAAESGKSDLLNLYESDREFWNDDRILNKVMGRNIDSDIETGDKVFETIGEIAGGILKISAVSSFAGPIAGSVISKGTSLAKVGEAAKGGSAIARILPRVITGAVSSAEGAYGHGGDGARIIKEALKGAGYFTAGGEASRLAGDKLVKALTPVFYKYPEWGKALNVLVAGGRGASMGVAGSAVSAGISKAFGDEAPSVSEILKTGMVLAGSEMVLTMLSGQPFVPFGADPARVQRGFIGYNEKLSAEALNENGYVEYKPGSGIWINPDNPADIVKEMINHKGMGVYKFDLLLAQRMLGRELTSEEITRCVYEPEFFNIIKKTEQSKYGSYSGHDDMPGGLSVNDRRESSKTGGAIVPGEVSAKDIINGNPIAAINIDDLKNENIPSDFLWALKQVKLNMPLPPEIIEKYPELRDIVNGKITLETIIDVIEGKKTVEPPLEKTEEKPAVISPAVDVNTSDVIETIDEGIKKPVPEDTTVPEALEDESEIELNQGAENNRILDDLKFTGVAYNDDKSIRVKVLFDKIGDTVDSTGRYEPTGNYHVEVTRNGVIDKDTGATYDTIEEARQAAANILTGAKKDNVTHDDTKKSIGYHAGDLGKSEHFGRQYGSNRGTGHFGTGTYLVGDKKNIDLGGYKDRPIHEIDLNNYNLFKPKNEKEATKLHDILKYANTYYSSAQKEPIPSELLDDLEYSEPDYIIDTLKRLGKWNEENFQTYFNISSDEYISKEIESPDIYRYLKNDLIRELKHDDEQIERALSRKKDFERDVESILGISKERATEIINNIYKDIEKQYGSSDTWPWNKELDKSDSISTRFMKELGYEGVDVRHIPSFDNTEYGSVIYDLKNNSGTIELKDSGGVDNVHAERNKETQDNGGMVRREDSQWRDDTRRICEANRAKEKETRETGVKNIWRKRYNAEVRFIKNNDATSHFSGFFDIDNGVIYVKEDSEEGVLFTASHELLHYIKYAHPEIFKSYFADYIDLLIDENDPTYSGYLNEFLNGYKNDKKYHEALGKNKRIAAEELLASEFASILVEQHKDIDDTGYVHESLLHNVDREFFIKVVNAALRDLEEVSNEYQVKDDMDLVQIDETKAASPEEKREEFAEKARRLSTEELREKISDLDSKIRMTQEEIRELPRHSPGSAKLSGKLRELMEKRRYYEVRIARPIEDPKTNTDKIQNALINEQLSIEGLEIAGVKRHGFDVKQRKQIAEELIAGSKTDKDMITIKVRDDGTVSVVNSEPVIADVMNDLGIKKTEVQIPYKLDKYYTKTAFYDLGDNWVSSNGHYAVKVSDDEIQAIKEYVKNNKIELKADSQSFKEYLSKAIKESTIKLTSIPRQGKEKTVKNTYVFDVDGKYYGFDKRYFDTLNVDGNEFFIGDNPFAPSVVKDINGEVTAILFPIKMGSMGPEAYKRLIPAKTKAFYSKPSKKKTETVRKRKESVQSYSQTEALTGRYPQLPKGDGSSSLKDTKSVDEIVKIIEKSIGIPIRTGKFRQRALGIFKTLSEVARVKVTNDLPVICHEIGHGLDKRFGLNNIAYNRELTALGMPTSKMSYPPKKVRGEGVAEFLRLYLTDPNEAQTNAPKFLVYFESVVGRNTLEALSSIRTDILNVVNLNEVDKVINDMSIGEKRRTTVEAEPGYKAMLSRAYDAWFDEYAPFARLQKRAEKEGYTGENLDTAVRLYRGLESKVLGNLTLAQTDLEANVIGKSFNEIMEPIKKDELNDFRAYMVARRAIDYENRDMVLPQSYAVYSDALNVLDNKHPHFADVFDNIREWSENELQLLVESGVMSQEAADTINEMNPNYVPLQRILEAIEVVHGGAGSSLGQSKHNIVKRAKGSGKTIIDPLESLVSNAFIIRRAAEANKINGLLYDMAKTVEGLGDVVEIVPPGIKGFKFNVEEISGVLQQILGEQANVKGLDLDKLVTLFRANYRERDGEVTYYKDGKPILMQLDIPLYQAIKGLGYNGSGIFLRLLNVPKKIIQAGAVTTVRFMAWNMAKDTVDSIMQSEAGIGFIGILNGYKSAFTQDKWYRDWVLHGGSTDFLMASDREKAQDILFDEVLGYSMSDKLKEVISNPSRENLRRLMFHTLNAIRRGVEWSEAGPKVAEFKKLQVKKGMTAKEAAKLSREVNQDFLKYGYVGKELNKITAFFNANIWGVKRIEETFRAHPFRTIVRGLKYIILPTMFFYFLNDENEKYKKMNVWRKALFYNIPLGNPKTAQHFLSIPKPYGWGWIFGSTFELALDALRKENPKKWDDLKEAFIVHFDIPLVPSAFGPIIDLARNESWNKTIIESMADRNKPSYLRYNERTSVAAKGITNVLKDVPFANKLSPKQLDYLVKGYTGSVGDFFWKLPDTIKGVVEDPGDYSKWPLARSVIIDSVYSSRSMDDFYTNGEELNTRLNEAKETGKYRAISHLPEQLQQELSGAIISATKEYNSLVRELSEGRKVAREIEASDKYSPAQKRLRKREIQYRMNKIADGFNAKYERFKKENRIK